jgi:RNA polymerase primary sigma factor
VEIINIFRKEIEKFELLTPEEEIALSRKIQKNFEKIRNLISSAPIKNNPEIKAFLDKTSVRFSLKDITFLLSLIQKNLNNGNEQNKQDKRIKKFYQELKKSLEEIQESVNTFVHGNLRLVLKVASSYYQTFKNNSIRFEDLIQEGCMGLMIAAYNYDFKKSKFSTYASGWIRARVSRFCRLNSKVIKYPVHFWERKRGKMEEIKPEISLDDSVFDDKESEENGKTVKDYIAGEDEDNLLENLYESELAEKVRNVIALLTPKEQKIIRLRFGIGEEREHTFREIGNIMNLSAERIRQIEKEVLKKIKNIWKISNSKNSRGG